jgi:Fur family ferric uptake transcriptional regulator
MNYSHSHIEKLRDTLTCYLEANKLRKTTERYAILECVCHADKHFDVETLLAKLKEKNFHVSRTSIYNTLELLRAAGLVIRHQWAQYELKGAAMHHHHLICSCCGHVGEIRNEKIKITIDSRIPRFTPEYHSLYIYGICSKCKFRQAKEQKTEVESKKNR